MDAKGNFKLRHIIYILFSKVNRIRQIVFCSILWLAFTLMSVTAEGIVPPADFLEARELCRKSDLRPVEGLWTYPQDDVMVLIFRNEENKGQYDIFVVEAADCSLKPGMKLGELHSSSDPDKFTIQLFTSARNGVLSMPVEAVATFSESKEALTVKKSSRVKLRLNPTRLLPSFWRIVSLSLNSNESAPEGMIKIFPSYDGNQSTRRAPRYL